MMILVETWGAGSRMGEKVKGWGCSSGGGGDKGRGRGEGAKERRASGGRGEHPQGTHSEVPALGTLSQHSQTKAQRPLMACGLVQTPGPRVLGSNFPQSPVRLVWA